MTFPALTGTPVLETERLILRTFIAADLPAFRAYATSSDRTRYTGGPKPEYAVQEKFASMVGHWCLRGFGRFAITCRETGRAMGHVGPFQLTDLAGPELTWTLWSDEFEGRGFALEAARRVNLWLARDLGWHHAHCEIDADNTPSRQLAEKLGGALDGTAAPGWMANGVTYRFDLASVES